MESSKDHIDYLRSLRESHLEGVPASDDVVDATLKGSLTERDLAVLLEVYQTIALCYVDTLEAMANGDANEFDRGVLSYMNTFATMIDRISLALTGESVV